MPDITFAHSPDTDDVFMAWALATDRLDTGDRHYVTMARDIEELNQEALESRWDVTAISFGAYPYIHRNYDVLTSGGSIGDGYGPVVVSRDPLEVPDLEGLRVAIPGHLTTAYLALRIAAPGITPVEFPFHEIGDAVLEEKVDAGLLIHEGQITYADTGLQKVVDLGAWWKKEEDLPLPLGGNAIRRGLDPGLRDLVASDLRRSIECALENREEALVWTCRKVDNIDVERGHRYIDMYVNSDTVEMPRRVRRSVARLFERAHSAGIIPESVETTFV